MQFLWSGMLLFLAVLPLLVILYICVLRRRARFALRYSSLLTVKVAVNPQSRFRRHIPPLVFFLAVATMLLASARPTLALPLAEKQATVILTIDVSASMLITDIKPSRLVAAKEAARAFVERHPDPMPRVGVVAFSETASVIQAPTTNRVDLLSAIQQLKANTTTAIGSGILTSLDAISERTDSLTTPPPRASSLAADILMPAPGVVILLTDGQNDAGPSPLSAAQTATERRIPVFTIGVGTPPKESTQPTGIRAMDQLDEDTLKQVAEITDARYFRAFDEIALTTIYQNLATQTTVTIEQIELTYAFVAIAIVLIFAGNLLGFLWFSRLP